MFLLRTESTVSPQKVKLTTNPDGSKTVRISDHLETRTDDTDGIRQTVYTYDEAVFDLPSDRLDETEESIAEHIPEWWLYASVDHSEPTMEERVALLEQIIMGGDI